MAACPPKPKSIAESLKLFLVGLFMGAADIVPGVSGGTMAFVLGIYENFILSISTFSSDALLDLIRFRIKVFFQKTAWQYLGLIIIGILAAIASLAPIIHTFLNAPTSREYLYSLFMGLILVSILLCFQKVRKWKKRYTLFFLLGAAAALLLITWKVQPSENFYQLTLPDRLDVKSSERLANYSPEKNLLLNVQESQLSKMLAKEVIPPSYPVTSMTSGKSGPAYTFIGHKPAMGEHAWYFLWGMIGVSAMLLPGISGSYMLLILGAYPLVIGTISTFVLSLKEGSFDTNAFGLLAVLGLGIVGGALLFSRAVRFALDKHHDTTMVTLAGFMAGALGTVWPFWTYLHVYDPVKKGVELIPQAPLLPDFFSTHFLYAFLFFFSGIVLILINRFIILKFNR